MPLEGPFPEYVEFANEHGILIRQEVHYEWIPLKCNHCQMFGHDEEHCKKKTEHTTPPTAPRLDTQAKHVENMESAEYAPVIKRKAAHLTQSESPTTQPDSINPFQALQGLNEEEHVEMHSDQELKDFNPCSTSQAGTGLNWPNKQEDVKAFLYSNQISLIGLLETKVRKRKFKKLGPIYSQDGNGITISIKMPEDAFRLLGNRKSTKSES
ncbi:LOW QUALITY PROTEIN: hypothetical protein Cgig2_027871 [Carnegiea gigantea]|uniref:Uncharacterized protein n=1 Tax=Carnegiea gigantea TaxID=171969 RepID=A0A9Q1KLF6_9CARY|nr:LOW QUALITY PROTEIN: hypothetical protein Cgig2_027871 [Carnegiea gigantea]